MNVFDQSISSSDLTKYTLDALSGQLRLLASKSRFRTDVYGSVPLPLTDVAQLQQLPFISSVDIIDYGRDMLCVSPRQVQRVVTLLTSGTTGGGKRLYFTENDLRRTVDFFAVGMKYLCGPGDRVAILMPGTAENGLCDLLSEGLRRLGALPQTFDPGAEYAETGRLLQEFKPDCIVGIPVHVRALALTDGEIRPKTVLLSADFAAESLKATIERRWGCRVFEHYGLTEAGLGCAVQCPWLEGMHIRHDELYIEIIDPDTGEALPAGRPGEIVISTLRREAMPLIRYRTGDLGMLTDAPCACGSTLPRLAGVFGRVNEYRNRPSLYQLDELLFGADEIVDYRARRSAHGLTLTVDGDAALAAGLLQGLAAEVTAAPLPPSGGRKKRVIM